MVNRSHFWWRWLARMAVAVGAVSVGCINASAAAYFVAPRGIDAADAGPADRPFATIAAALERAGPGDRVILRAGEYRATEAVRFPHAGAEGRPVTLAAAPGEYVAILGSVRLTQWERHEGSVWKAPHPEKHIRGLYEDGERLTHPRPDWGRREDPPLAELRAPGTWTQDAAFVYLWSREGDSPANHRIEASQRYVMVIDKPWIRVEGLHLLFGQNVVCEIAADHVEVVRCEIAHCSNSVDNSYNAYFSGCSNSAFRECLIHDSFYWGDHGSNSHVVSCIDCGDRGPNFVDRCEIFNGGLGVGTKGAAREMVVTGCRIRDVVHGVVMAGERDSGPGAGKKDRGHYVVWRNRVSDCRDGAWIHSGGNQGNHIWNNLFERCGAGVAARNYEGEPRDPEFINNVFAGCDVGIEVTGGRNGQISLPRFIDAGLKAHHNLFWQCRTAWRNPLSWSASLDMDLPALREKFPALGAGSICADPLLDPCGRPRDGSPTLGAGANLELPAYLERPPAGWDMGLGRQPAGESPPDPGLTLSIAGSQESAAPGQELRLRAAIANESRRAQGDATRPRDSIVTFHFGYRGGHFDKQELYRVRVQLPQRALGPGESLDLAALPGWQNPVNGKLGDLFHLRTDTKDWKQGCRLWATARFVDRGEETAVILQRLDNLLYSKEVVRVRLE